MRLPKVRTEIFLMSGTYENRAKKYIPDNLGCVGIHGMSKGTIITPPIVGYYEESSIGVGFGKLVNKLGAFKPAFGEVMRNAVSRGNRIGLLLNIALSQVGISETLYNTGPQVDIYLQTAGGAAGQAWCVAFAYWCYTQAGLPMHKTLSSSDLYRWAVSSNRITTSPQRGDIYIVRGGSTGHYHTGIIYDIVDNGMSIIGISGNSGRGSKFVTKKKRTVMGLDFVSAI